MSADIWTNTQQTYYDILEVGQTASNEQIMEKFTTALTPIFSNNSSRNKSIKLLKSSSKLKRNHCIQIKADRLMIFRS